MILHKKRNFSDLINDTFGFLKAHGGHYFKHFFIINGGMLLILVLLIYLTFYYYLESLFSNINNFSNPMDVFINNNPLLFVGIAILFILLIAFISLINISYPILYMGLLETKPIKEIQTKDLILALKKNAGRIIVFFMVLLAISIPLLILYFLSLQLESLFLLLLPIYLITIPVVITIIYQSLFQYLVNREKLINCFQLAFETLKLEFWSIVGSTIIIFIIVQVAQTILTMIPYVIYFFSIFLDTSPTESLDHRIGTVTAIISGLFVFMILLNYTFSNLLSINQGMIFYSFHETKNNKTALNEIDLIGTDTDEN